MVQEEVTLHMRNESVSLNIGCKYLSLESYPSISLSQMNQFTESCVKPDFCEITLLPFFQGPPRWLSVENLPAKRGHRFYPWVGTIVWRRKCQPTPGALPAKSHGQRRQAGYSPWGLKRVRYYLVTKQQQRLCKIT